VNLYDSEGACRKVMARHAEREKQALLETLIGSEVVHTAKMHVVPDVTADYFERAMPEPAVRERFQRLAPRSLASVPLTARGRTIGVLHVTRGAARPRLSDADLPLLQEVAHLAGLAIENARLHQATTHVAERQRFLAEVGAALADSIDYWQTVGAITDIALREMADWCVLLLVDGERLSTHKIAHADPAMRAACELLERFSPIPGRASLCASAIEKRAPVLVRQVGDALLRSVAQNAEHLAAMRALQPRSVMALPLLAHGRVLGCIALVSSRPDRLYELADLELAADLAHRAAMAVDNARLYDAARQALEARDQVMAVVSHDLKNALMPVQVGVTLLQRGNLNQVHIMERAVRRMSSLVDDLHDMGMIESGRFSLDVKPEPLRPLLAEVVDLLSAHAEARSIHIHVDRVEELTALCDQRRMAQVLFNLVGNAIKFTSEGGVIRISALGARGYAEVFVTDSGSGIGEDELPHVFDRFWKGRAPGAHGAGLGLYIARAIVEAHGGTIHVHSRLGQGTTFSFTVPLGLSHEADAGAVH
jgi:signal transduction histidine kinase